jgi:hypothetical protein
VALFFRGVPYILAVATIAAGAIDLYLKRGEYKNKRLKQTVAYSGASRSRFRVDGDRDSGIMPIMIPG